MDSLSLIVIVIQLVLIAALVFLARNQAALRKELVENRGQAEQMMDELKALYGGAAGQVNHIARLEQQLNTLTDKQEQMDAQDPANQSYSEAIQLVQRGASIEDLMRRGMRREEAELLLRLHGRQTLLDES